MKAILYRSYGGPDVLNCEVIEKPVPKDNEVLIKVRAASLNPLDWRLMRGRPFLLRIGMGLRKPKDTRFGRDLAGEVLEVGRDVTSFKPGDEVFGASTGALAEYVCASESNLAIKPSAVPFDIAASIPIAALTALQSLRDKGQVQPGQRVLINGAAGGVGTFAVQLAKSFGAHVTAVCSSKNAEMVRGIGADRVVDYTVEDFTRGADRYDLILDNIGNHSLSACRRVLNPKGTLVMIGAKYIPILLLRALQARILSSFVGQQLGFMAAKMTHDDLAVLSELVQAGKVKPVIERRYPLSDVRQAVQYLEEGHARGKIIVTVN